MTHTPRKRFGQHFLSDKNIITKIIQVIAPKPEDKLVEIGPGQGAITLPLLKIAKKLDVIELDWDLIPQLMQRCEDKGDLNIHQADALKFNFAELKKTSSKLRVVGNLPYNISTPLLFHLLSFADMIEDMHFMLQKEVVDRMAAAPGSKHYGRLSVMIQYHCKVTALFDVPPGAFFPPPRVESSIVRLVPHQAHIHKAIDYEHFSKLVKESFSHRRKTLKNCLKHFVSNNAWDKYDIDFSQRAEQISLERYVKLSNDLVKDI